VRKFAVTSYGSVRFGATASERPAESSTSAERPGLERHPHRRWILAHDDRHHRGLGARVANDQSDRHSSPPPRRSAAAVVGLELLTRSTIHSGYGTIVVPLLIVSFGMGPSFVRLTLTAVSGVEPHEASLASALLNTTQQVGGALGECEPADRNSVGSTCRKSVLAPVRSACLPLDW